MSEHLSFKNPNRFKVRDPKGEIEVQDVFLDKLALENKEDGLVEKRIEVALSSKILWAVFASFFVISGIFLLKTLELQVVSGSEMAQLAQRNAVRTIALPPNRGIVYDSSMKQLVLNKASFDFVCDKRDMPVNIQEKEILLRTIAAALQRPFEELKEEFDAYPYPEMLMAENISHEHIVLLQARAQDFPGCSIKENVRREYVQGENFAHVIGYTAKISPRELAETEGYSVVDQIGKMGIEKTYESFLRGVPGKIVERRDSQGKAMEGTEKIASVPGESIVLHVNAGLQEKLTASLQEVFRNTGTKKAAAVALDPNTGGVLALVSLPSFDNNMFSEGVSSQEWNALLSDPLNPLFNRVMSGIGFPTGSVIKPLVALGALEEHVIEENTSIYSPYEVCVWNQYAKKDECFRDWKFHGESDVKRAIAESVNTFFYIIGGGHKEKKGLGAKKLKEYIELFGWGKPTGIDLPGEGSGKLPNIEKNWRLGDTYHFSIGQGAFSIPPLQVAAAFGAIANKGTMFEPHVAWKFVDSKRNVLRSVEPHIVKKDFVGAANLEIVRKGMRQTVTAGSATGWLDRLPVQAAAKTGTAQTGRKTADGKDFLYSWTVSFAPYDKPEIVLVVMVEEAREGQVTALPVVRDALQWYFRE